MDGTKLDFTLINPHSPQSARFTQRSVVKNQEHQVLFSLSAISSQLDPNAFDLARNFGSLSGTHQTEGPYPYHRPCDILSPDQHRSPFPQSQEAPLTDVTSYIYDSGSSSYPSHPQASHSSYNISSGHEAFHANLNEDLSAQSLSLSISSSLDLAIQTSPTTFSSIPLNYSAVRRYHEDQSRQHAQVLQQLRRSRDGCRQSPTDDLTGNGVLSASLEITPTGRRAELYHAISSIPMSNIRPHQPRPPEHTSHHSEQSRSLNQYQYPYYHNQDLGYQENCRSEALDVSPAHGLATQMYESGQHESMSVPSPSTTNSATVALESNMYTMRSGPRSNAIQSMSQPSIHLFEETTATAKVPPSSNLSDMPSITSPFPVLTNGTDHEDPSTGGTENLIEIESENGEEETLTKGRRPRKEGTENIVAKRRDKRPSEGSGATARRRAGDPKNDSIIKDGLSPPTKKRKKSKMHECQVCHKNFPRPSGLKTHMNTHNNERPYPCPYPGCSRSFGVRSNAKRHLRTHGVIPPQNTGAQPYVVDFSTPMVLEQDGRMGLNGGEGTNVLTSRDDDGRSGGVPHTQRLRPGRGRGRQFKLRWMPPSSSRSAMVKGKGRKKAVDSPSDETGEMQDVDDLTPSFSRSPSQQTALLDRDEDPEEDEGDHTDGEADAEMEFDDEQDEQDDESDAEEVDRSEEEFGASTAMRTGVTQFHSGLAHHSPASSSRTSLSSSLSASASISTGPTSAFSLPPSASSSSLTSLSPIHAQNPSLLGGTEAVNASFPQGAPISSSSQNHLQATYG